MAAEPFDDGMSLAEAREVLRDLVDEGHRCPCCTQFAKIYRRKIHATMARDLIAVYRRAGRGWFHLPSLTGWGGDFGKLRYWGLVEEETDVRRDDGGRAGYWRVTELGESWVTRRASVPRYARLYDGRCLKLVGDPTMVVDALGDKFNYRELMSE